MLLFFVFIVGMVVGGIIYPLLIFRFGTSGTLKIDHSNPKKDVYLFEMDDELEDLSKSKRIILKVDNNAHLSQD